MNIKTIITAGGNSSRYGNKNKLLEKINDKEMIVYTVDVFNQADDINEIIICANLTIYDELCAIFENYNKVKIIEGGNTRQKSVLNGLSYINECDFVLIHDGARPMITSELINKTISEVINKKAVTVATKTIDTIKQVDKDLKIIKTLDRNFLYNTQTPQAFEFKLIKDCHEKLIDSDFTDDAGMLEFLGYDVHVVNGDYKNIKITTQSDINLAKIYLK